MMKTYSKDITVHATVYVTAPDLDTANRLFKEHACDEWIETSDQDIELYDEEGEGRVALSPAMTIASFGADGALLESDTWSDEEEGA